MDSSERLIFERVDARLARNLRDPQPDQPFVTLTYAQSLDGSISLRAGQPLRLSNDSSMRMTHGLRARHDAILVGINTVLADDPHLTVRLVPGKSPQPVVVDSQLRIPLHARLCQPRETAPIVATSATASRDREQELGSVGMQVVRIPTEPNGYINLRALLAELANRGIRSLMVEGGARILTSFFSAHLGNQFVLTVSPVIVGGLRGVLPATENETRIMPALTNIFYSTLEDNLIVVADLVREPIPSTL